MNDDNKKYEKSEVHLRENLYYHDQLKFRSYIYKIIGISGDDLLKDHHRFIISFLLKCHPLYWHVVKGTCRFCGNNWKDPLHHLIKKCKDGRVYQIGIGIKDPKHAYFRKIYNQHNKRYDYIFIRQFLSTLFKNFKSVLNSKQKNFNKKN